MSEKKTVSFFRLAATLVVCVPVKIRHLQARRALLAAGMSVRQINPVKLRPFAKASGVLAKNDRLDACMIASFVAIMPQRGRHCGAGAPTRRNAAHRELLTQYTTVARGLPL